MTSIRHIYKSAAFEEWKISRIHFLHYLRCLVFTSIKMNEYNRYTSISKHKVLQEYRMWSWCFLWPTIYVNKYFLFYTSDKTNCTQKKSIFSCDAFFVHLISFLIYDQYAIRCSEVCAFSYCTDYWKTSELKQYKVWNTWGWRNQLRCAVYWTSTYQAKCYTEFVKNFQDPLNLIIKFISCY